MTGYPGQAVSATLSTLGSRLYITVVNIAERVAQTSCKVGPAPGGGGNPAWPGNCDDFVDLTPPSGRSAVSGVTWNVNDENGAGVQPNACAIRIP
ncbi:hypothetical protein OG884_09360 [Streptosporangium sp. NBC_01755]|uniref:hypothetical protein n=1 Tax=unclassified Streptosporangium TaxID=2632669 RepID=UPI002DDA1D52|nr:MULTISPECIES: hypothetical protein [unclassified Streptosporangium]WSA26477.1 hypothetical protein OIE13_00790 [Streptosporangium sp. NBC_01810]WSD02100.1 hypothetical protein OG884_09360 [Streptosporangium sp. NBC_01755]